MRYVKIYLFLLIICNGGIAQGHFHSFSPDTSLSSIFSIPGKYFVQKSGTKYLYERTDKPGEGYRKKITDTDEKLSLNELIGKLDLSLSETFIIEMHNVAGLSDYSYSVWVIPDILSCF
jgi:hypothetical protein